jgi:hypothetical protein
MDSFSSGTYKILSIKSGQVYYPIGCLTSNSFSERMETIGTNVSTKNGWQTIAGTNQSYNISFDGLVTLDPSISNLLTYEQLKQQKRNRIQIQWQIQDQDGNIDYGEGFITSLSDSASIDEFVSFTGSIIGQGVPFYNNLDPYYGVWFGYKQRVELDGGTIISVECTQSFINELIFEEEPNNAFPYQFIFKLS